MDKTKLFKNICNLSNEEIAKKYLFLGEGISREVYSINKYYVIKVAKIDDGSYQNRIENHVYTHATQNFMLDA